MRPNRIFAPRHLDQGYSNGTRSVPARTTSSEPDAVAVCLLSRLGDQVAPPARRLAARGVRVAKLEPVHASSPRTNGTAGLCVLNRRCTLVFKVNPALLRRAVGQILLQRESLAQRCHQIRRSSSPGRTRKLCASSTDSVASHSQCHIPTRWWCLRPRSSRLRLAIAMLVQGIVVWDAPNGTTTRKVPPEPLAVSLIRYHRK